MTKEDERRIEALKENLAMRLRPVCENWPPALFAEMITQLATITIKYECEEGLPGYDRGGTDRLIADMKDLLERNQRLRTPPTIPPIPALSRSDEHRTES